MKPKRTASASGGRPKESVEIVYGLRAALAVIATTPAAVLRVGLSGDGHPDIDAALAGLDAGVPVVDLDAREMDRICGAPHHEGIVVERLARAWTQPAALADLLVARGGTALALDRVRNSYNIGAILRSAAFFGVDAVLLGAPAPHPGLDANAVRVAEGGAEHVVLSRTTDLADTLGRLRARGVKVYGADGEGKVEARGFAFPRPSVVVMGNEREGLGPRILAHCDAIVAIRGGGAIESLNVGVAAGVLLAELTRPRLKG